MRVYLIRGRIIKNAAKMDVFIKRSGIPPSKPHATTRANDSRTIIYMSTSAFRF